MDRERCAAAADVNRDGNVDQDDLAAFVQWFVPGGVPLRARMLSVLPVVCDVQYGPLESVNGPSGQKRKEPSKVYLGGLKSRR